MRSAKHSSGARGQGPGLIGDLFRLVAAAALLGSVAFVTVNGVTSATDKVQRSREQDRVGLAQTLGGPLGAAVQSTLTTARAPAGQDALFVDRNGRFTGVSGRYRSLSGAAAGLACPTGSSLRDLVDAANRPSPVFVMVVAAPGSCDEPIIGAAAPVSGGTVVVTSPVDAFLGSVAFAKQLPSGAHMLVVDPAGTSLSWQRNSDKPPAPEFIPAVDRASPALAPFLTGVRAGASTFGRHTSDGGTQRTEVVDAGAPVGGGWSVIVEQDAAGFDVGQVIRPSSVAVLAVGALFLTVLLLQGLSDSRRRAAAKHADAHAAAFLAVLGHELRTPLTVIKGFVDTLVSRWGNLDDAQRHEIVDRLPQQSRRLNRVVDRLLLAANLQAGSAPKPALAPVDVAPVLERIADGFAPMAPLHEFIVEAGPEATVQADSKALEQILSQLVDNAVKYSPSGGTVRLTAVRRRGRVDVSVEDEGVGLPSDARGIFEAFAQGEGVDGRVHDEGGVGLGLYIARTLCAQLGGSVRAERGATAGARFVVTLRACRQRVVARV
jgi:signal transduction histidine kinase